MRTAINTRMRGVLVVGGSLIAFALACASAYYFGLEFLKSTPAQGPFGDTAAEIHSATGSSDTLDAAFLDHPREVPVFQFTDEAGHNLTLADFRGRPIVLNIWATWCVPCRKEMPSLDRLQSLAGKSQLLVLALSIDLQGAPVVKRFYEELGLHALGIYLDPASNSSRELKTVGVPTTLLIDRDGREIGRKIGAEEWDNPFIVAELQRHLGFKPAGQSGSGGQ